jgi:hypothetical protein
MSEMLATIRYTYERGTKKLISREAIEIKEGTIDDSELKRIMLEEFIAAHPDVKAIG